MGFFYYRRRMTRRSLLGVLAFSAMTAVLASVIFATTQMRPILVSLATTRVSNMVNRIVSEAVDEAIEEGNITYSDLITFEKDNEGRITAIYSNMAAFNRLQSNILDIILARIDQVSTRDLSIPVGSLSGSVLLAGRGPRISVRMESVGSSFHSHHGIQRRHRGGNRHRGFRTGHLHLFQSHTGELRKRRQGLYIELGGPPWTTVKRSNSCGRR